MEIVIVTCAYKRPEILKLFLENYKYLKEQVQDTIRLTMVMAGCLVDDPDCYELSQEYKDVAWVEYKNQPLGEKWNAALNKVQDFKFDAVLIMGSDDLINVAVLDRYYELYKEGYNFLGIADMYVLNSQNGEMIYWGGYTAGREGMSLGAGRLIGKDIVEALNYKLWEDDINTGLDGSTMKLIDKSGIAKQKVMYCRDDERLFLMDVKSAVNIWEFAIWRGTSVNAKKTLKTIFAKDVWLVIKKLIFADTK